MPQELSVPLSRTRSKSLSWSLTALAGLACASAGPQPTASASRSAAPALANATPASVPPPTPTHANSPAPSSAPPSASARPSITLPDRTEITARAPDAFYDPPAQIPTRPGALLRSEPLVGVKLPAGMRGLRLLYATTVDDATPATAVATVFIPVTLPPGPRPVLAWAHATTGLLQKCMPSLLSQPSLGIPARDRIVQAGWVVVATDYSFVEKGGPHPYLIGEGEARAVLDAVRAARRLSELRLAASVVIWGHSQGGHAALWAGAIARRYAPELVIAGVAAIAPAGNMKSMLEMNPNIDKWVGPYIAGAYGRFYPDVSFEQALRPEALETAREIIDLCEFVPLGDSLRIAELARSLRGPALSTSTNRAFAARLEQNTADREVTAPLLVAQGQGDFAVPPQATDAFVEARCAAGQRLEYWKVAGTGHETIVLPGSPLEEPLVRWTRARFANEPQLSGCSSQSF